MDSARVDGLACAPYARPARVPGAGGSNRRGLGRPVSTERLCHVARQIVFALLDSLAHLEAREASHRDLLADFSDLIGDQILDLLLVVVDPRLIDQAEGLVELFQLAGDDLVP